MLLWASSPSVGAGWLAWAALVPAAAASIRFAGSRAGRLAVPLAYAVYLELLFVPSFPFGMAEGEWGDAPPVVVGGSPVLAIALVAIPALAALLYATRFGSPWLGGGSSTASLLAGCVLVPAISWTALDFVRVELDPGGYWGPLFLSQHDTPAAPLAALAGPWLLTFVIVAVGYALALVAIRGRAGIAAGIWTAGLVAVIVGGGLVVGGRELRPTGVVPAAVQPGYHTPDEDVPQLRFFERGTWYLAAQDLIDDLRRPTLRAARQGANLVVWPEAAIWVDPYRAGTLARDIAGLARAAGAARGVAWFDPDERHGAAITVDPERGLLRAQPKQRPMWFLGEGGGNRSPPEPVEAGGHVVGTLLGVDTQQPGLARRLAAGSSRAEPSDVLAASTHDWDQLAGQQQALLELSALASGVPVVRADWRYRSSVIDGDGSVAASAGPDLARAVVMGEEVGRRDTPYRSIGDALGWAAAGLAAAWLAWVAFVRARRRRRVRGGRRRALSRYGGAPESLTISKE